MDFGERKNYDVNGQGTMRAWLGWGTKYPGEIVYHAVAIPRYNFSEKDFVGNSLEGWYKTFSNVVTFMDSKFEYLPDKPGFRIEIRTKTRGFDNKTIVSKLKPLFNVMLKQYNDDVMAYNASRTKKK